MEYIETDLLVVGSGLAGLCAALRAEANGVRVAMATMGMGASPNVNGSQAWFDGTQEGFDSLYHDVMETGGWVNDPEVVKAAVENSQTFYPNLESYGVPFRQDKDGNPVLRMTKTASGTFARGKATKGELGLASSIALTKRAEEKGINILKNTEILFPIMREGRVIGAVGVKNGEFVTVKAKAVVLACGGVGSLVACSSYPNDVRAGYVPLALMAGAEISDMEFLQFEPTVCCNLPEIGYMPVPTALWAHGAKLFNAKGERFIKKYGIVETDFRRDGPIDKELVAHRINLEIVEGRGTPAGGIWYDARDVAEEEIKRFTIKVRKLASVGVDLTRDPVEARPGAHSHMGGVVIDSKCASSVPGLFAAGESASGLLGASRMAGFGGSSAITLGDIAGKSAADYVKSNSDQLTDEQWNRAVESAFTRAAHVGSLVSSQEEAVPVVSKTLGTYFGITKDANGLETGLDCVRKLLRTDGEDLKTENIAGGVRAFGAVYVAQAMFTAALARKETRGTHCRSDFPEKSEEWGANIRFRLGEHDELLSRVDKRHIQK